MFNLAYGGNEYIKRFQVYTGKGVDCGNSTTGLCTRVVLELLTSLQVQGVKAPHVMVYCSSLDMCSKLFTHYNFKLGEDCFHP